MLNQQIIERAEARRRELMEELRQRQANVAVVDQETTRLQAEAPPVNAPAEVHLEYCRRLLKAVRRQRSATCAMSNTLLELQSATIQSIESTIGHWEAHLPAGRN